MHTYGSFAYACTCCDMHMCIAYCILPMAYSLRLIAYCIPPIAYGLLHVVDRPLPIAYCMLLFPY